MADVVASGVLNSLLDRLRDRITSEFGQLMDVGTELKKLAGTLSAIRDVLEDAEARQVQEKALKGWLRRLKDVAYDIDDLLDEGLAKNRKRSLADPESSTASWMMGTILDRAKKLRTFYFHASHGVLVETENSQKQKDEEDTMPFSLPSSTGNLRSLQHLDLSFSRVQKLPETVCHLSNLRSMNLWCCHALDELPVSMKNMTTELYIIMDGLHDLTIMPSQRGRRAVFEDCSGSRHSELCWIRRQHSKEFRKALAEENLSLSGLLLRRVKELINASYKVEMIIGIEDGTKSWKIRLDMMGYAYRRRGKELPNHQNTMADVVASGVLNSVLDRLTNRMVEGRLMDVGAELKKLEGTLTTIRDVLADAEERQVQEKAVIGWLRRLKDVAYDIDDLLDEDLAKNRKRSLTNPESSTTSWMMGTSVELEDVGYQYIEELLLRSLFEEHRHVIGAVVIHDLVHDLAQFVSSEECSSIAKAVNRRDIYPTTHSISNLSNLLTLNLECCTSFVSLPNSVGHLKSLQTLNLTSTRIKKLPESICCLSDLRSINLRCCLLLRELPENKKNTESLTCLSTSHCHKLTRMPAGLRLPIYFREVLLFDLCEKSECGLKELNRLNPKGILLIYSLENVKNFQQAREANLIEMDGLNALSLAWDLDTYKKQMEACVHTDVEGRSRQGLINALAVAEEVLDSLQPHENLTLLKIIRYPGKIFPKWLESSLPNLVQLQLSSCFRCKTLPRISQLHNLETLALEKLPAVKSLPPLGQLPALKVLHLVSLLAVKSLGSEFYGAGDGAFPVLENLSLEHMPELEEWCEASATQRSFPCLSELRLLDCPKLKELPLSFPSVEQLYLCANSELLLSSLPRGAFPNLKKTHLREGWAATSAGAAAATSATVGDRGSDLVTGGCDRGDFGTGGDVGDRGRRRR
ncbi:putative disease resistance protein RGA3 [Ananas comosus]|uniref:Putative disease resistance protein RGA3 n=1 Tax=Ananas comosus TaxID=4615 RepID=A0A199VX38_ANACO|nr:putative disease resistance protein RGA3 [Ananas comosus]